MQTSDKKWFMEQIEKHCTEPQLSNYAIINGRCDLEIVITVSQKDETLFTQELLDSLRDDLSTRTGFVAPVIYLEGNEPEWLGNWFIT